MIRVKKLEGHYTIKILDQDKLPKRGNANWLYSLRKDNLSVFYRWTLDNEYEKIEVVGDVGSKLTTGMADSVEAANGFVVTSSDTKKLIAFEEEITFNFVDAETVSISLSDMFKSKFLEYIPIRGTETDRPVTGEVVFFDFLDSKNIYVSAINGIYADNDYGLLNPNNNLYFAQRKYVDDAKKTVEIGISPASATSPGAEGDIIYTTDFIYICVATNTWKRTPLNTW